MDDLAAHEPRFRLSRGFLSPFTHLQEERLVVIAHLVDAEHTENARVGYESQLLVVKIRLKPGQAGSGWLRLQDRRGTGVVNGKFERAQSHVVQPVALRQDQVTGYGARSGRFRKGIYPVDQRRFAS